MTSEVNCGMLDLATIGVLVDGSLDDLLGDVIGMVLVELDVRGAGDLHLGRGGDHLGVEVLGQVGQRLHDALHVDDHRFYRAGDDGQFLVQEVAGRGNALAHQCLVAGAADPGQRDALGAFLLGVLQ